MIPIYPETCTDFTTNGLGLLTPIECMVEERAGGLYELTLVHPIDESLRFTLLQPGAIVKAPSPVRETPLYEAPAVSAPATVKRRLWEVERTTVGAYLRSGPGTGHRALDVKRNGDRVLELEDCGDPWIKVCVVKGGQLGYMSKKWLGLVGEVEETISPGAPAGGMVTLSQSRDQLFRIYSVEQDSAAATVTARALHIFYDAAGAVINADLNAKGEDVSSVIAKIAAHSPINISCLNLSAPVTGDYGRLSPVEALLNPDGGILSQIPALLVRDNFEAVLIPDTVRDRGVTIRRGKNLIGAQLTMDDSGVVNRILPVGRDKNGNPLYLPETYVDSPRPRARVRARRIEYDVQVGENGVGSVNAAREKLRFLAMADFTDHGLDLPACGMDVDFVLLGNAQGYENYATLQAVHLYDTVTVIDESIHLQAKLKVTGYRFNCLTKQYAGVTLGEIQALDQTISPYALPDGSLSGSKIVPGSITGASLQNAAIGYAKINTAAVEQLSADALTALTARIREITADKLTADELYAAFAELIALKAGEITADKLQTDALAAELARITVLIAGSASFDRATVQHLVAQAMNLEYGAAGQLFIRNLAVEYAQMLGAAIGELCVKAADGRYYLLNVNPDGTVSATPADVSANEVSAGQTEAGRVILETSITAANLNTGNLLSTYALVNKIDAARIDVDALFAREAFIDRLCTGNIVGGQSITMIAQKAADAHSAAGSAAAAAANAQSIANAASGTAANAQAAIDNLEIGGRNLLPFRSLVFVSDTLLEGTSTKRMLLENSGQYGGFYIPHTLLESETDYVLSYDITCLSGDGFPGGHMGCDEYNSNRYYVDGTYIGSYYNHFPTVAQNVKTHITVYFRACASDQLDPTPDIYIQPQRGTSAPIAMRYLIENLKIEKGNRPTGWAPAPEDVDSSIEAAQRTADAALPVRDFQRVVRVDTDGLHVGDNQTGGEVLIDSESVNVVMGGRKYSRFAANYVQFGLYQLRQSADGGLVFKL